MAYLRPNEGKRASEILRGESVGNKGKREMRGRND